MINCKLSQCPNLTTLNIVSNQDSVILDISACPNLTEAVVMCGPYSEVKGLSECTKLSSCYLPENTNNIEMDAPSQKLLSTVSRRHDVVEELAALSTKFKDTMVTLQIGAHDIETVIQQNGTLPERVRGCLVTINLLSDPEFAYKPALQNNLMMEGAKINVHPQERWYNASYPIFYITKLPDTEKAKQLEQVARRVEKKNLHNIILAWLENIDERNPNIFLVTKEQVVSNPAIRNLLNDLRLKSIAVEYAGKQYPITNHKVIFVGSPGNLLGNIPQLDLAHLQGENLQYVSIYQQMLMDIYKRLSVYCVFSNLTRQSLERSIQQFLLHSAQFKQALLYPHHVVEHAPTHTHAAQMILTKPHIADHTNTLSLFSHGNAELSAAAEKWRRSADDETQEPSKSFVKEAHLSKPVPSSTIPPVPTGSKATLKSAPEDDLSLPSAKITTEAQAKAPRYVTPTGGAKLSTFETISPEGKPTSAQFTEDDKIQAEKERLLTSVKVNAHAQAQAPHDTTSIETPKPSAFEITSPSGRLVSSKLIGEDQSKVNKQELASTKVNVHAQAQEHHSSTLEIIPSRGKPAYAELTAAEPSQANEQILASAKIRAHAEASADDFAKTTSKDFIHAAQVLAEAMQALTAAAKSAIDPALSCPANLSQVDEDLEKIMQELSAFTSNSLPAEDVLHTAENLTDTLEILYQACETNFTSVLDDSARADLIQLLITTKQHFIEENRVENDTGNVFGTGYQAGMNTTRMGILDEFLLALQHHDTLDAETVDHGLIELMRHPQLKTALMAATNNLKQYLKGTSSGPEHVL